MANHAEKNAPFIRYFLSKIGTVLDVDVTNTDLNTMPKAAGLYVFYVKFNPTSKERYPIYVGITGRSFRQRFKEHATNDGVIDKVCNGRFPTNHRNLGLYAYLVEFNAITSKFLESVLLEAFDFCLNTDENFALRTALDISDQYTADNSKQNFNIFWDNIMQRITEIDTLYRR